MLLIKSFFRKSKTKENIKIFVILFSAIILLNVLGDYTKKVTNQYKLSHENFVMFAKNNHEDIIKKYKGVDSYSRAVNLEKGPNNNIIYDAPVRINEYGETEYIQELVDESKLEWGKLIYKDGILAFSSSSCNLNLKENEVVLALIEGFYYQKEYKSNYINHDIQFNFENKEISLIIKDIIEPKAASYVCISDSLYNELIQKEKNYIYNIEFSSHEALEKAKDNWHNLESNDYFIISNIQNELNYEETQKHKMIEKISIALLVINIIATIVFIIITILTIKNLISEEEPDILLLKQIGYNNSKNFINTLKNLLVFDLIVIVLSIIITTIIILLLNLIFSLNIKILNLKYYILIVIFTIIVEFIFTIINITTLENSKID